ncbi:putative Prepilin-type N-terminal cleavage/methylation domain-containing protein [uncultured Desulfobacterium sp.]|uniref:Putative Prepilin-type N-terminal cleavage/methylation domain-containing protein n=1 Tax=uncultured Desulfobacterium sp. TaxID=201089 RepID=A0A445MVD3_9BACT|nr:putative Prepilin-type N-terminal cleavage/methylation domain-containing protein [uncultured Desulfobacterium sp.]
MFLKNRTGFTLLEVLVALLIIGISLGAVFQAFSQSKRISWKSDEQVESCRIAHNILADSQLIDSVLRQGKGAGIVQGEEGWQYTMSVTPLELNTGDGDRLYKVPSMLNLDLCLIHNQGQRERAYYLSRWYRR